MNYINIRAENWAKMSFSHAMQIRLLISYLRDAKVDKNPVHFIKMTYPGQMTGSNRGQQTEMVEQMVLD